MSLIEIEEELWEIDFLLKEEYLNDSEKEFLKKEKENLLKQILD